MPTSNVSHTSAPRRPGLGRRAISSHAAVNTPPRPSTPKDPSHLHTQKAPGHKPRPHVVGGSHRAHHHHHHHHSRNPSFGKSVGKLHKFTTAHHIGGEVHHHPSRFHQRKKSAPVTPAGSPRGHHHVHWDGFTDEIGAPPIKKNYSSPSLHRNSTGAPNKKALASAHHRPHSSSGKKKTVGFELGDSDYEGEWEDTTQSPEGTRYNSAIQNKENAENAPVLVDPLVFVKRPYPQFPRASSLPEPSSIGLTQKDPSRGEGDEHAAETDGQSEEQGQPADRPSVHVNDHGDIASRLLSPSHSTRAPPAMSSVSATVKPAVVDNLSRNSSLTNMAAAHDLSKRTGMPSSNSVSTIVPGNSAQGTSSSMEAGVSRFIADGKPTSRTDSDPNTPSSFLPHYHPQTPPSPNVRASSVKTNSTSPPPRPRGAEPHSRTQQKLWLQRTAALNTSPPDSHGGLVSVSPAAMDPTFRTAANSRPGSGPYDPVRRAVNGNVRAGVAAHDSESKHIRRTYEKTALELAVVRRFQSPTADSFDRLSAILNGTKGVEGRRPALSKPVKSSPALMRPPTTPPRGQPSRTPSALERHGKMANPVGRGADTRNPASPAFTADAEDLANSGDSARSQHPSQRILSAFDDVPAGSEDIEDQSLPNESELMIRRLWDSREVATSG